MKKHIRITLALFLVCSLVTVSASAVHGGASGAWFHEGASYYVKQAKWTTTFDSEIFDLKITDWSWAYEDMQEVVITDTTYSCKVGTIMISADMNAPWFEFLVNENANPGTYEVSVSVTGPDGSQIDSWSSQVVVQSHDFSIFVERVNPTCTAEGYDEYACLCGVTIHKNVPALGHTIVTDAAVAATHTSTGLTEGSHCSACGAVTVKQEAIPILAPMITGIVLDLSSATLNAGESRQLRPTISPAIAGDKSLTWASSNTAVSTVDGTGLVTAVASGTATITATAQDGNGVSAACVITIKESAQDINHGDANADGSIDIMDLVSIIDFIVSDTPSSSMANADANGDGTVDIMDLVWIIDVIVS